jgi:hypothetical protein
VADPDEPRASAPCFVGRFALAGATAAVALTVSPAIGAEDCPPGDLLRLDGVRGSTPQAERLVVGRFAPEGSDAAEGLPLGEPLTIDLGAERTLRALMIQADHDDAYLVEGSLDGTSWSPLAVAREVVGGGLRSRAMRLSPTARARRLRISGTGGDGSFWIAAISAWCRVPEQPPVAPAGGTQWWRRAIPAAQLALASLGLALFGWGVVLRRLGRPEAARRGRDGVLAALGLLAGLAWWNFGFFHASGYVHRWEQFHYFLGGKYFDELGYTRLYTCVTVADFEDGLDERIRTRKVRDMTTNRAEAAVALVAEPERCKRHFTNERWTSFKHDVAWFRGELHPAMWERIFLDHGYNAPPAWGMLGETLTRRLPASNGAILALALLDLALLLLMWGAVMWAFGWRATCVALLWWGTNQMAFFSWTGGGLLRQDWLVLSVLGICLVRRRWAVAGGFALGYATLLRIFPGLIVAALALQIVVRSVRARRLVVGRDQVKFGLGCLVAFAVLLPISAATSGGFASWRAFVDNARANTRATGVNTVGLMSALCYKPSLRQAAFVGTSLADPDDARREAKRDLLQRRRPVLWILVAGFVLLLARALRDREDWATLALGVGLIPIAVFVASYYYSVLLTYGLLWDRRRDFVGVPLCALSVATHVGARIWPAPIQMDSRFAWNSLATVVTVVAVTLLATDDRATRPISRARVRAAGPASGAGRRAGPGRAAAPRSNAGSPARDLLVAAGPNPSGSGRPRSRAGCAAPR